MLYWKLKWVKSPRTIFFYKWLSYYGMEGVWSSFIINLSLESRWSPNSSWCHTSVSVQCVSDTWTHLNPLSWCFIDVRCIPSWRICPLGFKCGQYASVFYLKLKPTLDMNNYVETGISFSGNLSKVSDIYCSCVMRVLVSDAC